MNRMKHVLWGIMACVTAVVLIIALSTSSRTAQVRAAELEQPETAVPQSALTPTIGPVITPAEFNGSLLDLPAYNGPVAAPVPFKQTPGTERKGSAPQLANWRDPVLQTAPGAGQMPGTLANFAGISFASGGGGWPPDTNGDVGPNHYIQSVNTSIAIFNKTTGAALVGPISFNAFFDGTGTPCDNNNYGDPVVVYDRDADRWLITDFAIPGPFYECLAISKTGDPVSGGWWFYAIPISNTALNDYPKVGVWPDAYYITFNMFIQPNDDWGGVDVWALERDAMLAGNPVQTVSFNLGPETGYGSLLPAHALSTPPLGTPNYLASVEPLDKLQIWEFAVDWTTLSNSTLTGPTELKIADFAIAASVPQRGSTVLLDSLSFRPMMQLMYREVSGVESLWFNHTVAGADAYAAVRWYQVTDPGGVPTLAQQSTYQPDANHRWMGSTAVDQDGNMAIGYSVSNTDLYPSIRYAGRLAGEIPGQLPQAEAEIVSGKGGQLNYTRWGDYSHMTVDPVDDCTFWYTTEYYSTTGTNWQTRIASFKFPSCGQPKAYLDGYVHNSVTGAGIPGVTVVANSPSGAISVLTDATGYYEMTLLANTYSLTANPLLPGYPNSSSVSGVAATTGATTTTDLTLDPTPFLEGAANLVNDNVTFGNNNGYPEPGEKSIQLSEGLLNSGAITATNVVAQLISLTPGLTIETPLVSYPDVTASDTMTNTSPFTFSVAADFVCGDDLSFQKIITASEGVYTENFVMNASVPLPRADIFSNDVESGAAGWTTGGTKNSWAITTVAANSPTHSWSDSPGGNYLDGTNSYVRTPAYNLTGKRGIQLTGWFKYDLETGYDYVYLEYSLNGGTTWVTNNPLYLFNGLEANWVQISIDASVLANQPNVAFRFRLESDSGVTADGIYIDDLALSYAPYTCLYTVPMFDTFLPMLTQTAP